MAKKHLLETRVTNDLEMIRELGHCSGIENYSRYFDGRKAGERPYCLLDFFPDDFLLVVDESHESIPQKWCCAICQNLVLEEDYCSKSLKSSSGLSFSQRGRVAVGAS